MDEIVAFLRTYPPFDQLPAVVAERAAAQVQIEYFAAGSELLTFGGAPAQFLYMIRKGSVELVHVQAGEAVVVDALSVGEAFGHPSLIRNQPPIVTVRARSEVLTYLVPAETFHRLRAEYAHFANFFAASALDRLKFAARGRADAAAPYLFQTRVRDLIQRAPVTITAEATVREAAQLMRDQNISCLIVAPPPYNADEPDTGIITDRDLRNRVLAAGLPDTTPLRAVMTSPTITLPAESMAFEALLLMLERHIHHLPIVEHGRFVGMVTHTDILRRQSNSPLLLPRQLERARNLDDLRRYGDQVAEAVGGLLSAGARVADIGRIVAVAHDALLQRLLRDAEAELGAPPVPYAWLVVGSQGRYEQTLRTDQDNALIYADEHPPEAPDYFKALATIVVERLVACGFPRCPGEIMATNPAWRQPLSKWQATFAHWIEVPDEEALLRCAIFFDYRQVHGTLAVEPALRPIILRARANMIFLARLARAALRTPAPLTLFRGVALEHRGDQRDLLDLKHRGTAIIVDLARIFALEAGRSETGTIARLRSSWEQSSLGEVEAERLIHAFELISQLRLRHQYGQMSRGEPPTNSVVFTQLSPLEQRELKESFQAVSRAQRALAMAFQTDRLA